MYFIVSNNKHSKICWRFTVIQVITVCFIVFIFEHFWVDVSSDLSTRECMQSQPLLKWAPCGYSPMSLLQSTKCMPDIFPFGPEELGIRRKTELAALQCLTAMFQMFYLAFLRQDVPTFVLCCHAHTFFHRWSNIQDESLGWGWVNKILTFMWYSY